MGVGTTAAHSFCVLTVPQLDQLLSQLQKEGYLTIGPTLGDGAIVYDEVRSVKDLPKGYADDQEAGTYRLRQNAQGYFAYVTAVQSAKQYLHPPRQHLWEAVKDSEGFHILQNAPSHTRYAFVGLRPCELRAIGIQDKVFLGGPFVAHHYQSLRQGIFTVVAQCTRAGGTCFCQSMGTGPTAEEGFDLALTEFPEEECFLVEVGSARGKAVMETLGCAEAGEERVAQARAKQAEAALQMGRRLDTEDLPKELSKSYSSVRWEQIARRCMSCGNCTMVCPTCFCTNVEDTASLTGDHAGRWQRWDSCFTSELSYIHGGVVRKSTASRYRQWLLHKLCTWHEQFGESGCVGCGRCITWCPVGIDITEEAQALRQAH
ncbi:MAG: 4Fe-4S dicluster domain-containing protein [Bryobacterales bacterium]|nr:4Fe-4S dicluster domain-containing protein [Bryobacterales bacterium]